MDKRPQTIGGMFDRIAPTYDIINSVLSLAIDRLWRKKTIRKLEIKPDFQVLDIASGTGDLAFEALSKTKCQIVGIDLSSEMLQVAHQKSQTKHYLPACGDALCLPFRDCSFDRAMVAFGVRNMQNLDQFLSETRRILRREGRLGILEFSLPTNGLIRWAYLLYFTKILPLIGGLISGDHEAYRYLRDSVMNFPPPKRLERKMVERGFSVISSEPLLFGIAHLYIIEKD